MSIKRTVEFLPFNELPREPTDAKILMKLLQLTQTFPIMEKSIKYEMSQILRVDDNTLTMFSREWGPLRGGNPR